MARVDVIMPQMGESIAEGTLSRWLKKIGDEVKRDEPIFEISTDKVDAEIPAPNAGVLAEISVTEGQTVAVGTVVARLETDKAAFVAGGAAAPVPAAASSAAPSAASNAASGAMVAVLVSKIVAFFLKVPDCAEGMSVPCFWYKYAGVGALVGALTLPTLVLRRLLQSAPPDTTHRS